MMKINKIALAGLASLSLLAMGCGGEHQGRAHNAEKAYGFVSHRVDQALDEIEANDAQRTKVNEVKDRLFDEAVAMRDNGKAARKAAFEELKSDAPDPNKLHALVDERMDEMREVLHKAVDGVLEVHGVLTPEQRAEIAQLIEERMARHDRD